MLRLLISDFDGTLVDTFRANLKAYQHAFSDVGLQLTEDAYRKCFGLRFERFMAEMGINSKSVRQTIRNQKRIYYPRFFDNLKVNIPLVELIDTFHQKGGMTAIASTARRENLENALSFTGIRDTFDLIVAGDDIKEGKPSPEIYTATMSRMQTKPEETLIFEDSSVGLLAAQNSGARVIKVEIL